MFYNCVNIKWGKKKYLESKELFWKKRKKEKKIVIYRFYIYDH